MRSNVENIMINDNVQELDNNLNAIEETLKDIIKASIEEIKDNSLKEKELVSLWTKHTSNISNFFFEECYRTGNKGLYKNIVKYMMFNR
jgi:hypothetical protein